MSSPSSFYIYLTLAVALSDLVSLWMGSPCSCLSLDPHQGCQTSTFLSCLGREKLTLVSVSPCPISPTFPVYSSAGYFPSAYKHAVSFHILKKRNSPDTHFFQLPLHFLELLLLNKLSLCFFSSFCSLLKLLRSVFCLQIKATETNSVKVTLM